MKRFRPELPDFNSSFTHSCNNLASYEMKKNKNPFKKITTGGDNLADTSKSAISFVKNKSEFQKKKEFGATLDELKTFSRPNLDEGNRFYEDTRNIYSEFNQSMTSSQVNQTNKVNNFSGYRKQPI